MVLFFILFYFSFLWSRLQPSQFGGSKHLLSLWSTSLQQALPSLRFAALGLAPGCSLGSPVCVSGASHTQETQTHIPAIGGLASRLDIIMSPHQVHKLAFQQENFPSQLLIKSFGKEGRFFHLPEVENQMLFPLLWSVLCNEKERIGWFLLLLTLV